MFTSILRTLVGCYLVASLTQTVSAAPAPAQKIFVTMGKDLSHHVFTEKSNKIVSTHDDLTVVEITPEDFEKISHSAHEEFNRCGGFMAHNSLEEAMAELDGNATREFAKNVSLADYSLNQANTVKAHIGEAKEINIRNTIIKLSSFRNRYYKSQTGLESQEWLLEQWKRITAKRNDIKVYKFKHTDWPQDTIVAEIEGASSEKIIVGGHADSVAGWWGRERAHAPGADDNASGIATMTEVLRVLVDSGYKPQKTIVFAAYAAEEVGLLGSKDMAKTYKAQNETILGVLQLDMTNFQGSEQDIVMMTDYTNEGQNKFIATLIDTYLPGVSWGYGKCGYACSDHASWTSQGFPASMPFEAKKNDMNPHIHTSRDTLAQSDNHAKHALKFAKMALAFVIELDN
ncbi:MAG: M20/M25/M40 family metallo-hydrolase [Bdellovibrionota bacterium]|nr:M20/M25/M40 family metallo-hydrolase [Bdellovibrionota bacterium]